MIRIIVTPISIKVEGHANYEEHGKDIVCSAVSALMQTLELRAEITRKLDGQMKILTTDQSAVRLIADGLKLIADNYPDYVEVIE